MSCFPPVHQMTRRHPYIPPADASVKTSLSAPQQTHRGRVSANFTAPLVPGRSRGATATLEKGGVKTVQYGTMLDLLREAERAGVRETEGVNERLAEAFDSWLSGQELEG